MDDFYADFGDIIDAYIGLSDKCIWKCHVREPDLPRFSGFVSGSVRAALR